MEAWWCAPDAVLTLSALPDVLPASVCGLDGRAVVGELGFGAQVPPVGSGVAAIAHGDETDTVVLWTDEYGVHVRGDQYAAAVGYLDELRTYFVTGDGPVGDLAAMAHAVRRVAGASVGRVRPLPFRVGTLLDAADTVAAAVPSAPGVADVLAARDLLDQYFRLQAAPREGDDLPSTGELRTMADDLRTTLATGSAGAEAADRLLAEAVMLRNYVSDEPDLAPHLDPMDDLVTDLRAANAVAGDVSLRVLETIALDYETTLADISDYLSRSTEPEWMPGVVPWVTPPSVGDPTDGLASTTSPGACYDGTRRALFPDRAHWPRGRAIGWYYSNINRYPVYHHSDYAAAVKRAFDNVTELNNDCGYGWSPDVYNRFVGYATQRSTDVSGGSCARYPDSYSVVGWSSFSTSKDGVLAFACVWRSATRITKADVTLNNVRHWSIYEANSGYGLHCDTGRHWDLESVMTHEFGHVAGLDDVPESGHRELTMSAAINERCGYDERTLGYGDAVGLAVLYRRR